MNAGFVLRSKLQGHECSKDHMLALCTGHLHVGHAIQGGGQSSPRVVRMS